MNTNLIDFRKLPSVDVSSIKLLPRCSGVYFALDEEGKLLYVGKASHLRNRWRNHHKAAKLLSSGFKKLHWLQVERENCSALEAAYIDKYKPLLNIRRETGKSYEVRDKPLMESEQINITLGRRVREDFQTLADYKGGSLGALLRQILEMQWASSGIQELIETARRHDDRSNR